ncbi:MAG: BrnA antitoxin family protein [Candidatus Binatia bacterium]
MKSDLAKSDAHVVSPREYDELPELTAEMLSRATVRKGGRPLSKNPKKLISIRLPADVIDRWRATGPGWQTRMAERLSRSPR